MTGGVMDAKETLERLADWWELPGGDEESQRLRAAAIRGVLEENEKLREIVSLYSGPAYAALLEENERLRADADRVAAACNVEMADLSTRWNAAEARIDAALASAEELGGMPHPFSV